MEWLSMTAFEELGAVAFHARVMFGMIAIAIACWEAASSQPFCPGAQVLGLIWRMPGTAQAELQVVFVASLAVRFVEDCGSAVAEVLDELQLVELEAVSVPLVRPSSGGFGAKRRRSRAK
jgi:hypothetical protein